MSFLLKGVFGGSSGSSQTESNSNGQIDNAADIIERLCDRVQSSSLIDDRRDAVRALKALVSKHKLEIGTLAMPILIEILKNDKTDVEICNLSLNILLEIFSETIIQDTSNTKNVLPNDINIQFSEVYLKTSSNIQLLIELLDEYEFNLRYPTIKLLICLIQNCLKEMQEALLVCPMAITKLIDLLNDSREVIRNECLILLQKLSQSNVNIQKIIAFENGFERIIEIIELEMKVDDEQEQDLGSVIIEDCLVLLLTILSNNQSNQILFKEGSFIKRLAALIDVQASNEWSTQKIKNLITLFKLLRSLVVTSNQTQIVNDYQRIINQCGLLHKLCALLMIQGLSSDILGECIHTIGDIIRGNLTNQQFVGTIVVSQLSPSRSLLIVLLMSMINEKQSVQLRYSILYLIQCYLYRNLQAKMDLIQTLVSPSMNGEVTTGQLICGGLLNLTDQVSSWLCSTALSHCLFDNDKDKSSMLRVQLAYDQLLGTGESITLLQQLMNILISYLNTNKIGSNLQRIIGYLMFIANWLLNSPSSVETFLSNGSNVTFLVSIISLNDTSEDNVQIIQGICSFLLGICLVFNTNTVTEYATLKLHETIKRRIGLEQFEAKLAYISQSELYTKSLQKAFLAPKTKQQLIYDYEFCRIFKLNETSIIKILNKSDFNVQNQNDDQIIALNDIIQKQKNDLNDFKVKLNEQQELNKILVSTLKQLEDKYQQLKDQNSLMKINSQTVNGNNDEVEQLRQLLKDEQLKSQRLQLQLNLKVEELTLNKQNNAINQHEETIAQLKVCKHENEKLNKNIKELNEEQENLLVLLQEMEEKCKNYKNILKSYGYTNFGDDDDDEELVERDDLT